MARSVKSLLKLKAEIDALFPGRPTHSDGWIGDSAHSSRKSDHNPEGDGTVDARDFTDGTPNRGDFVHDVESGADMRVVWDAIAAKRDPRLKYMIFAGKIMSGNGGPQPWVARPYSGPNKHFSHLHVSVHDDNQDDTSPWLSAIAPTVGFLMALTDAQQTDILNKVLSLDTRVTDIARKVDAVWRDHGDMTTQPDGEKIYKGVLEDVKQPGGRGLGLILERIEARLTDIESKLAERTA